jgi:hypothetical protein
MVLALAAATRRQFPASKTGKHIRAEQSKAEHYNQQGCPDATHYLKVYPQKPAFSNPGIDRCEKRWPDLASRQRSLSECHRHLATIPPGRIAVP